MTKDESNPPARQVLKAGSVLAKLYGWTGLPVSGPVGKAGDAMGAAADRLGDRLRERRNRRMAAVLWRLGQEVELQREATEEDVGLFEEILEGIIRDEDDRKISYYVAFVDLYLNGQWGPAWTRVVAGALKALSKEELEAFDAFVNGPGGLAGPAFHGEHLNITQGREFLRLRLASAGLMPGTGTIVKHGISPLGKVVAQILAYAEALEEKRDADAGDGPG